MLGKLVNVVYEVRWNVPWISFLYRNRFSSAVVSISEDARR